MDFPAAHRASCTAPTRSSASTARSSAAPTWWASSPTRPRSSASSAPYSRAIGRVGHAARPLHDPGDHRRRQRHCSRQPASHGELTGGPARQGPSLLHQAMGHDPSGDGMNGSAAPIPVATAKASWIVLPVPEAQRFGEAQGGAAAMQVTPGAAAQAMAGREPDAAEPAEREAIRSKPELPFARTSGRKRVDGKQRIAVRGAINGAAPRTERSRRRGVRAPGGAHRSEKQTRRHGREAVPAGSPARAAVARASSGPLARAPPHTNTAPTPRPPHFHDRKRTQQRTGAAQD